MLNQLPGEPWRAEDFPEGHPIPTEELTLLSCAVDEALELAGVGQWEQGRQKLRRGVRETRAWKAEPWGPALTGYWLWALRRYDGLPR